MARRGRAGAGALGHNLTSRHELGSASSPTPRVGRTEDRRYGEMRGDKQI